MPSKSLGPISAAALLACTLCTAAAPAPVQAAPVTRDVHLLAKALIMTGTDMPVVDQAWVDMAIGDYVRPTLGDGYTGIPVTTPAQFWPITGPDDLRFDDSVNAGTAVIDAALATAIAQSGGAPTAVFGYSQSSIIATAAKRNLARATAGQSGPPAVSFVLLANPNRPNGGINARFAGQSLDRLGWTFTDAAPTDTPYRTVDVARQYDLFADFPTYPRNLIADANAVIALRYGAHDYTAVTLDPADPKYDPNTVVQQWGDTTYYFIPEPDLPLLRPLREAGADPIRLDAVEPALKVLVEYAYDRDTPFGVPTKAQVRPREDVVKLRQDLTAAVEQGKTILASANPVAAVAPKAAKKQAARGSVTKAAASAAGSRR